MRKISSLGFTLVELLIALALSAVIITQIGIMWMGASQVLRVLDSRKDAALEKSLIALEKMAHEIQSSPVYPTIPFEGNEHSVSFPEITQVSGKNALNTEFRLGQIQEQKMGQVAAFGKVEYYFDDSQKALVRKTESGEEKLVEHVEGLWFSYALSPLENPSWKWTDKTPGQGEGAKLGAIRVRLKFDPAVYRYTIPGIERTFLVARVHPLNTIKAK